jgi:hypothetical protein
MTDRKTATPRPGAGFESRENKMRIAAGMIFAGAVSLLASSAAWAQSPPAKGAPAAPAGSRRPGTRAGGGPRPNPPALQQSNALGIGRTVEIDTTGGPGFGFEHFKELDFLRDKEVVLTFDDGPVAGEYACGPEGAGGGMHHGHLLPDRKARHLLSRNPQAGDGGRPFHRIAHLVACRPRQQEADRAAAQG